MKKIRTLIAHNDVNITNDIVKAIENLEYVDIVGTANDGKETYNKIIDLKPEMVFAKYNMENIIFHINSICCCIYSKNYRCSSSKSYPRNK